MAIENSIDYLNNFSLNKIIWDSYIEPYKNVSKSKMNDTVLYALDTENTNFENKRCITYATQLMEFGKKVGKTGNKTFVPQENRKMYLFTHPSKFWEYVHNIENQKLEFYVFNAEYDVNNLLNFAIQKYNLKEYKGTIEEIEEYDEMFTQTLKPLTVNDEYTYSKITRNGKIYKAEIQFKSITNGKNKGIKKVTIYDMAKKTIGKLVSNVESFTPLKMNKADLDYTKFRDFGHTDYQEEELLYMWNDVYCLCDFTIEYLFSGNYKHTDKLTTSSMALENYKDELTVDMKEAFKNTSHKLYRVSKKYYEKCKNEKIQFMIFNKDNGKYKKLFEEYNNYLMLYPDGEERFILEKYFTNKDIFNYLFPKLSFDEFEYCKPSYCGGITRYSNKNNVGKWINKKGMGVDINSSFPYSYTKFKLPYGRGKYISFEDNFKLKKNKLYIMRFKVNSFKIKNNCEPNISKMMVQTSNAMLKKCDTWIKQFSDRCIITCTSIDYEYFINHYEYENLEELDGYEFNCLNGFFDRFTNKFYGIKCQKGISKGLRNWVKLLLNGVYGKFGQNVCAELREDIYNPETNSIEDTIVKKDDININLLSDGVYLPLASFVTSYSRIHLITVLNIINKTDGITWQYCDTDSSYITGSDKIVMEALKDYIDIDYTGELGKWKIEKYFDKILIIGIKKYIYYGNEEKDKDYSYHCTLSGINGGYFKFIEKYCEIDENCIREISADDRKYIIEINDGKREYYTAPEKDNPFIYKDKECKQMIYGAYRSIRKKTVTDGQILFNTIYCIKGDVK